MLHSNLQSAVTGRGEASDSDNDKSGDDAARSSNSMVSVPRVVCGLMLWRLSPWRQPWWIGTSRLILKPNRRRTPLSSRANAAENRYTL